MDSAPARQATYRDVFRLVEARVLLGTQLLSLVGDVLATVALTILVYTTTQSPLYAAATFAVGYLPWLVGGPILAALADRLPWRGTMVACDLIRAGIIALLALPGVPLPLLLGLLFVSALLAPPFEAARSALMPVAIPGDRFVLANAIQAMVRQGVQVGGFLIAGVLVTALTARGALLVDAISFALSAIVIRLWIRRRPAAERPDGPRRSLLTEAGQGIRLVLGHRVLRMILALALTTGATVYASEGLSAPFAEHLGGGIGLGGSTVLVGLLLAAIPVGEVIGGVVLTRFVPPQRRARLVIPLALMSALALVPLALDPPVPVVLGLYVVAGFGVSSIVVLNATYVRAVASHYRGRAFGVAQSGVQVAQGLAVLLAGALATFLSPPFVVALCGTVGGLIMVSLALRWPSVEAQNDAMAHPAPRSDVPSSSGESPETSSTPASSPPESVTTTESTTAPTAPTGPAEYGAATPPPAAGLITPSAATPPVSPPASAPGPMDLRTPAHAPPAPDHHPPVTR